MKNVPRPVSILFGVCASFLSSCHGLVELGHDGATSGSTDTDGSSENVFLTGQNGALQIFVDDSRVYWTTHASNQLAPPTALRSCIKEQCSSTLVTYVEDTNGGMLDVAIDNANVYWFRTRYNEITPAVLSCPHAGCPPTPNLVIEGMAVNASYALTSDGTYLYWASSGQAAVFQCEPSDCRGTLLPIAQTQANPQSIVVSAGYVYWVASEGSASFAIRRAAVGGTLPVETIASGQSQTTSLAIREPYIYFNNKISVGTISFCPVTGCNGSPTILASGLNLPTSLVADNENVYWLDTGEISLNQQTSLLKCALSGCESPVPALASFVHQSWVNAHSVAVDGNYVYWVASGAPQDASKRYGFPDAIIHRMAK